MSEGHGRLRLVHAYESHFDVSVDDTVIASYVYNALAPQWESPKPYFSPIRTLAGDVMTIFRPYDHPWHKGLYLGLPYVGSENLYGGPTYDGHDYVFLDNNGSMVHEAFDRVELGSSRVIFAERLGWFGHDGRRLADEQRDITINVPDGADQAWFIRFSSRIHNCQEDALVLSSPTVRGRPSAGYGGLMWRGPRSFTGGQILGSGGRSGPEMMGQRAQWLAFVGYQDGKDLSVNGVRTEPGRDVRQTPEAQSTIVFVDAEESPRQPTQWFVRTEPYAMVGSAPFFDADVVVPKGDSFRLACSVVIADGAWGPSGIEKYVAVHGLAHADQDDTSSQRRS
jgi:hypothetical protein